MQQNNYNRTIIKLSILIISIYTALPRPSSIDIFQYIKFELFWIFVISIVYISFFNYSKKIFNTSQLRFVKYYLFWNIIMSIVGLFLAEGYWEYKSLFYNAFGLFMPILCFTFISPYLLQKILHFFFGTVLIVLFFLSPFIDINSYSIFLLPFIILLVFFNLLDNKWKVISIITAIFSIFINFDARSSVIKFSVVLLVIILSNLTIISEKWLNGIRIVLMVLPFFLLSTTIIGVFNPFNMDSYINGSFTTELLDQDGNSFETNLKSDTRTLLYVEVIETANYYKSWIYGRSPAKGNKTDLFYNMKDITGKAERSRNEVAILNIFMWTGLIGVILYFLIFFRATWLAINKSNSKYIKLLGLYLAFRWFYSWVEDINDYTINYYVLWILIAIAFSDNFRSMNDRELRMWIRGIFNKRYQMGNVSRAENIVKNENSSTHNLP